MGFQSTPVLSRSGGIARNFGIVARNGLNSLGEFKFGFQVFRFFKNPDPMNDTTTAIDLELECSDCLNTFVWTAGEQAFYAELQLQRPKRCKACRLEKRRRHAEREFRHGA